MKVRVRVFPNAKKDEILSGGNLLKVRLRAKAVRGEANAALIELLASFFNVKKRNVKILRGEKSRDKLVEIGFND